MALYLMDAIKIIVSPIGVSNFPNIRQTMRQPNPQKSIEVKRFRTLTSSVPNKRLS